MAPRSDGEIHFLWAWKRFCTKWQIPVEEYRFHEKRRWRFDFAWVDLKVAVEIDGGRWKVGGGRHGSDADMEKLNTAQIMGWIVLRFTPQQVKKDPLGVMDFVIAAMQSRASIVITDYGSVEMDSNMKNLLKGE